MPVEIQQSGTSDYSAADGEVTLSGGSLLTATFSSPFGEVSGSDDFEGEGAGFACEGNQLTMFIDGFPDLIWNRVP